jgi:hypothetical protein
LYLHFFWYSWQAGCPWLLVSDTLTVWPNTARLRKCELKQFEPIQREPIQYEPYSMNQYRLNPCSMKTCTVWTHSVRYTLESLPLHPHPANLFFHFKNNPLCKQSKIAHCARFCFAAGNRLKNVVFTLQYLANQKGRCKKPVLRRASNSMWKPDKIILKLYCEDADIFYCFKLANINRFFRISPITYRCADPFQNILSAGFIRLLWRNGVVRPPPPLLHLQSVVSIPPQYAYVLLCSYYFLSINDFFQVLWKSSEGRSPYRLSGKTIINRQGFAPSERPQGLGLLVSMFSRFRSDAV